MAIGSLQLPSGANIDSSLDFSPLARLGQVYQQANQDAITKNTLANLGQNPNGRIDTAPLIQSGNLQLATLGLNQAQRYAEQDRQAAQDTRQTARDAKSDMQWAASYALQKQNADRLNASPAETASDRAKAASQYGIDPGTPEFKSFVLTGKLPDNASATSKVVPLGAAVTDGTGKVLFKNEASSTLSDQTVNDMADQYLAGDRTVLQNLGRGAQGAENVVKLRTAISDRARAAGVDPKGIVENFNEQAGALAGQRTVGTRAANISLAANEANNMIPIALDASAKVPRTQWMPINQAIQAYQKGTSSPELASFVAATNSLVNAYVRAVSPSGVPTDSMRQHAYDMLNSAQGPEAYAAVVGTMQKEMQAALSAPSQVRKELRRDNTGEGGGSGPAGNVTRSGVKWSVE
ncbi:MAG: hypothetical protein EKK40_07035 [Bradyrhizobiaceae bacterium]|nr:MAG: hypothetical protein EKK40_07035 [Bradyrhizobiaceae bacterium]